MYYSEPDAKILAGRRQLLLLKAELCRRSPLSSLFDATLYNETKDHEFLDVFNILFSRASPRYRPGY